MIFLLASSAMDFLETFRKFDKQKDSEVPRALEIQKRKFLCAIGKAEPSTIGEGDEKYVKECNEHLNPMGTFTGLHLEPYSSQHWTDTVAHEAVKQILEKQEKFDIDVYIDCAKAIYLTYSGNNIVSGFYEAFTYILVHARLFGRQDRKMFQYECNSNSSKPKIELGAVTEPLSKTNKYMTEVTRLIEDLKTEYNETKYRILNGNVTYLTLLILRRLVRNSSQFSDTLDHVLIHNDYVKLCPHPLDTALPKIGKHFNRHLPEKRLQTPAYLAIHAFLTVKDARSKQILLATCIRCMEWNGLQLPDMFFRVVRLYGIEEAELWDNLCFDNTFPSLFKLANDYYMQYKKSKADPPETAKWFPYCRVLNGDYHRELSAKENLRVCLILAYLIDLKNETSRFSVSHWAKTCINKESALQTATALYEMLNNQQIKSD